MSSNASLFATIDWKTSLHRATGADKLMAGVELRWDFDWSVIVNENKKRKGRKTFPRCQRLAELVKAECMEQTQGTHTPVLLLTVDETEEEGSRQISGNYVVVVHIHAYLEFTKKRRAPDPAATCFALRCKKPITALSRLRNLDLSPEAVEAIRPDVAANRQKYAPLASLLQEEGVPTSMISSAESGHAESVSVPTGPSTEFSSSLFAHAALSDYDLEVLLHANQKLGAELLVRLLKWGSAQGEFQEVLEALQSVDHDILAALATVSGIASIKQFHNFWTDYLGDRNNIEKNREEYWQKIFTKHHFLLEHLFAYPITIVKEKAYAGGKDISNTGGNLPDYLLKNDLTGNAVILEIKTPGTNLLGPKYRGVYSAGPDLSGGVVQVLNYRNSFTQEWASLKVKDYATTPTAVEPPCLVVIGNTEELDSDDKRKSFELFRRQFVGVTILTFDEVFRRTEKLIWLLAKNGQ